MQRNDILKYLNALNDKLQERSVKGEICLYGGAVMCLVYQARPSTKDIDAVFSPSKIIRTAAREIGREHDLSEDWLNDGVKGFLVRTKDPGLMGEPFALDDEKTDSILASTVEYLCDELGMEPPQWVWSVPACKSPWFVSGCENLKALAIAESPVFFRRRKIFVLENFLSRI